MPVSSRMRRTSLLSLAGLVLGLAGAFLLGWIWRQSLAPAPSSPDAPPAVAPAEVIASARPRAAASTRSPLDAALAAMLRAINRGEAREGEAVFTFKDDASFSRFLAHAKATGLRVDGVIDALRSVRVRFDDPAALRRALLHPDLDAPIPGANHLVRLPLPPAREDRAPVYPPPRPFNNTTLAAIGAAGDRASWGRGLTIAVLDTGISADPTFGTGRVYALDIGYGTTAGHSAEDGHGTGVAALAAGASPDAPGVAPGARLLSIRVTDAEATSDIFTLAQGIVTATEAGAKIINVSLGGYATGAALDAAIGYAGQQGALVVAAAGNDQAAQLAWPAADPRVISVGAIDAAERQVSFSNSGSQLKLSAPGYGVQTAWLDAQRVVVDGTSASAPIVAGALAAVLSLDPNLSPTQAAELLFRTANDTGQPGADPDYGHGVLNLATALNRRNPSHVDTAVSSQFYDEESQSMRFVVQNRSGRTVSGLTLNVDAWGAKSQHPVSTLDAGATQVVTVPVAVKPATLERAGRLVYSSQLLNPPGIVDADLTNNQRQGEIPPPAPPRP